MKALAFSRWQLRTRGGKSCRMWYVAMGATSCLISSDLIIPQEALNHTQNSLERGAAVKLPSPMEHLRARAVLESGPTSCVWIADRRDAPDHAPVVVKVRPPAPDVMDARRWGEAYDDDAVARQRHTCARKRVYRLPDHSGQRVYRASRTRPHRRDNGRFSQCSTQPLHGASVRKGTTTPFLCDSFFCPVLRVPAPTPLRAKAIRARRSR